ncbi:MAG: ABC transporter substrate-binding protein [candidate division WOR-3 bacterium]
MSALLALGITAGGGRITLPPVIVMVPLSGEVAPLGEEFLRGWRMAVGDALNYEVVDTYASPDSVLKILNILAGSDGASLIVGPLLSVTSLPAADFAMRNRIPILLPTATDLRLGTFGSYVFPFNYNLFLETAYIMEVMSERMSRSDWLILYTDMAEDRAITGWFISQSTEFGIGIMDTLVYSETEMVYDGLSKAVVGKNPKVVFAPRGSRASALLFLSLRKRGLKCPVVGLDGWLSPDVAEIVSGAMGGLYVVGPERGDFMARALAQAHREDFEERYRAEFGSPPSEVAGRGYDAGCIAKEVCFDNPDRETVKRRLLLMGVYKGVTGDIMLSKDPRLLAVYTLKKGGFKKEESYGKEEEKKGKP